ncbi:hypothetical protein T439DRAFT_326168 [Meredithblackwellia eburnea MCA 4105]
MATRSPETKTLKKKPSKLSRILSFNKLPSSAPETVVPPRSTPPPPRPSASSTPAKLNSAVRSNPNPRDRPSLRLDITHDGSNIQPKQLQSTPTQLNQAAQQATPAGLSPGWPGPVATTTLGLLSPPASTPQTPDEFGFFNTYPHLIDDAPLSPNLLVVSANTHHSSFAPFPPSPAAAATANSSSINASPNNPGRSSPGGSTVREGEAAQLWSSLYSPLPPPSPPPTFPPPSPDNHTGLQSHVRSSPPPARVRTETSNSGSSITSSHRANLNTSLSAPPSPQPSLSAQHSPFARPYSPLAAFYGSSSPVITTSPPVTPQLTPEKTFAATPDYEAPKAPDSPLGARSKPLRSFDEDEEDIHVMVPQKPKVVETKEAEEATPPPLVPLPADVPLGPAVADVVEAPKLVEEPTSQPAKGGGDISEPSSPQKKVKPKVIKLKSRTGSVRVQNPVLVVDAPRIETQPKREIVVEETTRTLPTPSQERFHTDPVQSRREDTPPPPPESETAQKETGDTIQPSPLPPVTALPAPVQNSIPPVVEEEVEEEPTSLENLTPPTERLSSSSVSIGSETKHTTISDTEIPEEAEKGELGEEGEVAEEGEETIESDVRPPREQQPEPQKNTIRFEDLIFNNPTTIFVEIITHLGYGDFRQLRLVSKEMRHLFERNDVLEIVLQRFLGPLGYRTLPAAGLPPFASLKRSRQSSATGTESPKTAEQRRREVSAPGVVVVLPTTASSSGDDVIRLDLRDLEAFRVGLRYTVRDYAVFAKQHMHAPLNLNLLLRLRASTRAWNRVVLRLRHQTSVDLYRDPQRPAYYFGNLLPPGNNQIFRPGRAPCLRVWVPTRATWMTDQEIVEVEREVWRSGVWPYTKRGDIVYNMAVGDFGNEGKLISDGKYLRDFQFTYDLVGHLPPWLNTLLLPPSYYHNVVASSSSNPVFYMSLSPFAGPISEKVALCEERVNVASPGGQGTYAIKRFVYRSFVKLKPGVILGTSGGAGGSGPGGIDVLHQDWSGTLVLETDGTTEHAAHLISACSSKTPVPFRILREKSRPGMIWLRPVTGNEAVN